MAKLATPRGSARLSNDPFPRDVSPMLALLSAKMPSNPSAYGFEFKWDGYRALYYWDGKAAEMKSRNNLDFAARFPEILPLGKAVKKPVVLDGEVVVLDDKGAPSFSLLQSRAGQTEGEAVKRLLEKLPVCYMIFDVLHYDGRDAMKRPYVERRAILEKMKLEGAYWKTPQYETGAGDAMYEVARKHGFEGVVAKRLESAYEPGRRNGAWLKIRFSKRQELVIGGYVYGEGALARTIGSLLLGYYDDEKKFVYAGHVGTGFSMKDRGEIKKALDSIRVERSPFAGKVNRTSPVYVQPRLVAEVQFTEWTGDGKLRHPSFVAFRLDKKARDVVREAPA